MALVGFYSPCLLYHTTAWTQAALHGAGITLSFQV
jgi:predicted GNAT superfamily acetyltransferase